MARPGAPRLGRLEIQVLDRLWSGGPADVKSAHRDVGARRGLAPNTIQSTLERLVRKGLAERRKVGRAYEYRARVSRREWVARLLDDLIATVPGAGSDLLLSSFVDLAERTGAGTLEELEELVRRRRLAAEDDDA